MPSATAFPSSTSCAAASAGPTAAPMRILLVPPDTELTEIARKRLAALKEFSDLGAGFKIAALDLELRGAGNLLGGEQHGHINSVGFDTYVRLLEETVRELKGEEIVPGDPLGAQSGPRHPHSVRLHCRREPAPARVPADRQRGRRRSARPCRKGTGGSIWPSAGGRPQPVGVFGPEDAGRKDRHRSGRPPA